MNTDSVRPNVLLVICDDLAYGDLSLNGNPILRTPHLDRLGLDGARCTRYLSGPLCTPARAALLTGRHPYRTRAIDTYLGRSTIDPRERTLAALLGAVGYKCGLFGKWHLGDTVPSRPHDLGFHEAFYHTGGGIGQHANHGRKHYFDPDLVHNGEPVATRGYCTDVFTDAALDFIDQESASPWFCYLGYNAPHIPLEIADKWVAPFRKSDIPETWARLYGMVANIDYNIGRLLGALEARGVAEDTIVIFTSDHGPCSSLNENNHARFNGGLRGWKGQMYEGGLRVPFLLRWPRAVAPGAVIDQLCNPIDVLPTLSTACGFPLPSDRVIDGCDLLPIFRGLPDVKAPNRALCMQWHRGNRPERYRNAVTVTSTLKWYRPATNAPDELYDTTADPSETHNIASEQPSVVHALREIYDLWFDDVSRTYGSSPYEHYMGIPIPIGDPREPAPWLTRQDWRRPDGAPEGWADDQPGDWQLALHQSGYHVLTVEFIPSETITRRLSIRCGPVHLARVVPPWVSTEQFDALILPAGPCTLSLRLHDGTSECGVNFARLEPRLNDGKPLPALAIAPSSLVPIGRHLEKAGDES